MVLSPFGSTDYIEIFINVSLINETYLKALKSANSIGYNPIKPELWYIF